MVLPFSILILVPLDDEYLPPFSILQDVAFVLSSDQALVEISIDQPIVVVAVDAVPIIWAGLGRRADSM